ncbi:8-oxoguanine deaminase [Roseovarius albus]|uniref:8-oxoguanine deaminase n=1 Tax=Roseovarius albus TaxID=1247867 RepID=A0A1X7A5A0_9RHOB|nr:formimidoylglutamate deiminase [Roseovarius albus]SLN70915.1 8-oxoguanine deaminase [Roseovarius albus]
MQIHAKSALLGSRWGQNVRVTLKDGKIDLIKEDVARTPQDECVDCLLPALANLHSHAFQRAMAGMTEFRTSGQDSFWTWRSLMYRFLEHLTPDQVEAIAALVFMEMQEAGYSSVGEFHYLHHQAGGAQHDDPSELSQRIFAAAQTTGIGLTHLPVLYTYGGVNQEPLSGDQLRFANDVDRFLRLVDKCRVNLSLLPDDASVGIAPHSLRATSPEDLALVLAQTPEGPIHIHTSEQLREVSEVEEKLGQRPVAWLLDNVDVNKRWCLIHATHMTEDETIKLARSSAVAGLCPITEANLGDGPFNGTTYLEHGGRFGLGSDSNVRISLTEELRTLEYSQRLRDMKRNVLAVDGGSTGKALYCGAAVGGAQALARDSGEIAEGKLADLVAIDRAHPSLSALNDEQLLDGLCFAAPDRVISEVWSAGRHMIKNGQHVERDCILQRYNSAIRALLDAL